MRLYDPLFHANTVDSEVVAYSITSSDEERYRIVEIRLYRETNAGIMRLYHDREQFGTLPTGTAVISNFLSIPIDRNLEVGETFRLSIQNRVVGTHAHLHGVIVYETY